MSRESGDRPAGLCVVVSGDLMRIEALGALAGGAGLRVLTFTAPESALRDLLDRIDNGTRSAAERPVLIIADLHLPGIDGWRFCRLLRSPEFAALNRVPILLVTAAPADHDLRHIAAGLQAEILPFSPGDDNAAFLFRIHALLRKEHTWQGTRVLLVQRGGGDDLDAIRAAFLAANYRVDSVGTVAEAIAAFGDNDYGLAVLDDGRPDGSAESLLERLGAERTDCAWIILSAAPDPRRTLDLLSLGAAACLRKPCDPDRLLQICIETRREWDLIRTHKQLEDRTHELRQSQERHEHMTRAVTNYVCAVRIENNAVVSTRHGPGCLAVTGYTEQEFDHNPYLWFDMVPPEDRDRVVEHAGQAAAGNELPPIEHRIVHKDGRTQWVRNTPVLYRDELGTPTGYDSLIQDITERMQAEEEIRKSEARLRQVIDLVPHFIFAKDEDGTFLFANEAVAVVYGTTAENLTGRSDYDFNPNEEEVRHFIEDDRKVIESGTGLFDVEEEITDSQGVKKHLATSKIPFTASGSEKPAILGVSVDITDRKVAEEALQESRDLLDITQKLAHIGGWQWDVRRQTMMWTDEVYRIHGFSPAQIEAGSPEHVARSIECYDPEDRPVVEAAFKRCIEAAEPYDLVFPFNTVMGDRIWVRTMARPVFENGRVVKVVGNIMDITDRKRMEEALQQSEERLDLAMAVKNEGIYDWNLVTNETSFDDRYYTMAGYAPKEFPQTFEAWAKRVHPDDMPGAQSAIEAYLSGKSDVYDVEFRFKHKSGSWIWIQGRGKIVARDKHGTPLRMIGTHTDITDRKRAEEALRSSQKHLQSIFAIAPTGIGVVRDRVLLEFNQRICEMTGYMEEELVGKNARILYPTQEDYEYVGRMKYQQIKERGSGSVETRWQHKDGTIMNILLASTPLDASDMSRGVTFTALDITERKKAEQRKQQEVARRQREAEVLSRVAGSDFVAAGSVQELAIELTEIAARAIEVERVGVWFFDENELQLTCADNYTASTGEHSSGEILLEHQLRDEFMAFKNSQYIDAHDALTDPRTAGYIESYLKPHGITSMLDAVIRAKGRNLGVLCFEHVDKTHRWQDDEIAFACRLADQIALAISHRDRRLAEEALRESEEKLSTLFASMTEMVVLHEVVFGDDGRPINYRITDCNKAYTDITGITREAAVGKLATEVYGAEVPPYLDDFCRVGVTGESHQFETFYAPMERHFHISVVSPGPNRFATVTTDITDIKRAEQERKRLQEQLNQAQKMESVGRLAGGVAHDFNNMLGVILGHTELAQDQAETSPSMQANLKEIRLAAERSADLTRQLLAFARKQTVTHMVLDINETVAKMLQMLRRLLGEEIDLVWLPGEQTGRIKMDPSQLDQILANLCINGRDAISGTGTITIETSMVVFDEVSSATHLDCMPGAYVVLSVSDDGCGMDRKTRANLFEPFFTTKEVGKGTGLGLSTVYGIVKQNDGFINVYSEPDRGSTFRIYLPRHTGTVAPSKKSHTGRPAALHGQETILVVEDEPSILNMTKVMLERFGYTVLPAGTPSQAVNLAQEHDGPIHLLMTDVVMPEMNGRDLAHHLKTLYPHIKRLFMSGYTANVIAHHGVLDEGVHFIQKPFTMQNLASKLKEALDSD